MTPFTPPVAPSNLATFLEAAGPTLLALGWLILIMLLLWIAWEVYRLIKRIDFVSAMQWSFLQITLPIDAEETPKAMEILYEVLGGMHKSGDIVEVYFDGYIEPWYSCEVQCLPGVAKYIMVVPTPHRKLFEGVIYGQYPEANIREVEDYSQRYKWQDLRETFEMWGAEVVMAEDDIYPIKTWREFENVLGENDTFVDPHQSMVEAFTNTLPGEEYWVQMCVRPMDAGDIVAWAERGQHEVAKISGQAKADKASGFDQFKEIVTAFPKEIASTFFFGPSEGDDKKDEQTLRFFNPVDEAKMKGILQKISQTGFKVKIRVIHLAPVGQLQKPNIARGFGVFKQFNTFHLNSLKPDSATKTNGPNYFMRDRRRKFKERLILLQYQSRDMWGIDAGGWMTAEELATLYHFPVKYVSSPSVERAKSGLQAPPENLPYA